MSDDTQTDIHSYSRVAAAVAAVEAVTAKPDTSAPVKSATPAAENAAKSATATPELPKTAEPVVTTEENTSQPVVEDKSAEAFKRLGKQESHLRDERTKLETMKKSLERERQDIEQFHNLQRLTKENPLKALEALGLSYEGITEHVRQLQNPIDPTLRRTLNEVEALKADIQAGKDRDANERVAKAEKYLSEQIDTHLAMPEYDLIASVDAKQAVREFMETIYNETGEIPPVKDACEAVADYIVQTYSKINNHSRFQPKEEVAVEKEGVTKKETKTLSNKMISSVATSDKPMTEQERIQAAIRIFSQVKN